MPTVRRVDIVPTEEHPERTVGEVLARIARESENMMPSDNYPRAVVRSVDGKLVLDDPDALAVMRVVAKHNCKVMLHENAERMRHFVGRIRERGDLPSDIVITCLNVDDSHGGIIADLLMPGHNWDEIRARGERPVARGLAGREGMQGAVDLFDKEAGDKLRATKGVAILVVDQGVAEIFTAEDLPPQ